MRRETCDTCWAILSAAQCLAFSYERRRTYSRKTSRCLPAMTTPEEEDSPAIACLYIANMSSEQSQADSEQARRPSGTRCSIELWNSYVFPPGAGSIVLLECDWYTPCFPALADLASLLCRMQPSIGTAHLGPLACMTPLLSCITMRAAMHWGRYSSAL